MSSANVGDIIEFKTAEGLRYAQVTHRHPAYAEVIRILPGTHGTRPAEFLSLVDSASGEAAILTLEGALGHADHGVSIVANVPVPAASRPFPTFRTAIRNRQGEVTYWWLWNGDGISPQAAGSEAQSSLPIRKVWDLRGFMRYLQGDRDPTD